MNKTYIVLLFISLVFEKSFAQKPKLIIKIDDKIETLYSIAFLNNYFLVGPHDNIYKRKLRKEFNGLKQHNAVQLFDSLINTSDIAGNKIINWVMQFDSFPNLTQIKTPIEPIIYSDNDILLTEFKKELINFHYDPSYQKYLKQVSSINEKVINQVENSKTIHELPFYLEEYYGSKLNSYNLILSPFLHTGGFNIEMKLANNQTETSSIIGPNGEIDFIPYFDKDYMETDMILHEFGHSFVNPISNQYLKEIDPLKDKYYTKELRETGNKNGYDEWRYVFNEIVLRATTIKITEKYFGKTKAENNLKEEISSGFGMVKEVVKILGEYENDRKKYPTFDKFYPILIKRLITQVNTEKNITGL